jgi:hypothetical protein
MPERKQLREIQRWTLARGRSHVLLSQILLHTEDELGFKLFLRVKGRGRKPNVPASAFIVAGSSGPAQARPSVEIATPSPVKRAWPRGTWMKCFSRPGEAMRPLSASTSPQIRSPTMPDAPTGAGSSRSPPMELTG